MTFVPKGYSNSAPISDAVVNNIMEVRNQLISREWDCLGVWVIINPPAKFPYADGDVVLWDDLNWRLCHDGEIKSYALDNQPIDGGMIRNASWAHRVSQWKVYSNSVNDIITLIDRSK